jgi:hypothetical protein
MMLMEEKKIGIMARKEEGCRTCLLLPKAIFCHPLSFTLLIRLS